MNNALIVVDVQNDFCEGGALAIRGGATVARDITDYVCAMQENYDLIIASKDWHLAWPHSNCGHFAENPNYVDNWPVHCVANTPGSEFHREFQFLTYVDHIVYKGYGVQSYSAFEGSTMLESVGLLGLLRSHDIENIDIVGLAYDYCVKDTAWDAKRLGFNTTIITNLTRAVHPENIDQLEVELLMKGIYLDQSS